MTTWDEAFASHYDEWSAHMTADIAFYVALALQADGPLVECNWERTGRHPNRAGDRPARDRIDCSPAMLEQAGARAAEAGVPALS